MSMRFFVNELVYYINLTLDVGGRTVGIELAVGKVRNIVISIRIWGQLMVALFVVVWVQDAEIDCPFNK